MSTAYAIEPGVTLVMSLSIACGRRVLTLFVAIRSCFADDGAIKMCLKNYKALIIVSDRSQFGLTRTNIGLRNRPLSGSSGSYPSLG
jgi:hypothetical protein